MVENAVIARLLLVRAASGTAVLLHQTRDTKRTEVQEKVVAGIMIDVTL